ncbi:hypothetical protein KP509_1Z284900 [Ceratopteris richardii]|nr:hypothetical protein KP509_1Z284900 [Ceratopteris richardii]
MPVRDADMYCDGCILSTSDGFDEIWTLSGRPLRTAGNRGASGIDGVLSTAIGFAVGSQQRVILLLGDLSFLHDTNGLSLLSKRVGRPPVVVIVVNNSGGGIFSLLPIANSSPDATFTNYFTTPHDVTLEQLSLAHKINHRLVLSKKDLSEALQFVHQQQADWIIEVRSSVEENAEYHRYLQISSRKAVRRAFDLVQSTRKVFGQNFKSWTIKKATYNSYKFQMSANPTSSISITSNSVMREGFILHIDLCDCSTGYGEVSWLPL